MRRAIMLVCDREFIGMMRLPLGATQRQEALRRIIRIRWGDTEPPRGMAAFLAQHIPSKISNDKATIDELYQAAVWRGKLVSSPAQKELQISYLDVAMAMAPDGDLHEYYVEKAREARARGEMVETRGQKTTRRQVRNTCTYHATCNLFADDIASARLTSKDVLREARRRNPLFASRSGAEPAKVVNGLTYDAVLDMSRVLASQVGKQIVTLETGELVRFMAANKTSVEIFLFYWEGNQPYAHTLLIGNPFVLRESNGERRVIFESYDSNYPRNVGSYIDADTLAQLMMAKGIALIDVDVADKFPVPPTSPLRP